MFPATIDPNSISGNSEPARKKLRVEVEVIEQELSHITEVVGGENCTEQAKSMPIVWNESTPTAVFNNGDSNMMSPNRENDFDQNLYSRQIYTLGESAMKYLRKSSVLISGMGSVGCEIAKNLILGGVRRITLHDTADVHWLDLSAHYYLDETDLGKNRAAACYGKLTKLNDSVTTELATEELTEEFVKKFDITIIAEAPFSKQKVINEWTRRNNRFFISADTAGLFAYIFVDCGPNFVTNDRTGEKCKEVLVEHIDAESGDVITLDKAIHGFESGDYVTFGEVKGMIELNDIEPIEIKVKGRDVFNIGSIAKNLSPYHEGGRAKEVKLPRKIEHLPLADSLRDPQFLTWDYAHFDYPQQLHFLWQALYSFMAMHGRRPNPRDESDLNLLKRDLRGVNSVQINEDLLKTFSYTAQGNLVPIVSIVGGFAAQEAMKLLTHHMTPLFQWLHINCEDALPGPYSDFDKSKLEPEDFEKRGTRYDGQVVVFGRKYQEALMSQNYFVVGAGAIGCELLKNLAMMGVGCSDKGEIRVTDMDQIVISNLNRQFLFRRKDIGENKALVAAKAVRQFNRGIHIKAYTERASGETESVFGDEFYAGLNGVINALDNVDARRYMDRRCILYRLPLLESGTMGTKGNTQVVYPYLTESYSSSVDPPEKEIPICTLKNFPNQIHHTIQWARELFDSLFKEQAESAVLFHENPRQFLSRLDHMSGGQKTVVLEQLISSVSDEKMEVAEQCIVWARKLFQKLFFNAISQLLHNFPPDQVTDHGVKFWSGTKRCPHPIQFDPCKEHHFDFVYAASVLMAEQYGIRPIKDKKTFNSVVSRVEVEPFYPSSDVQISITDEEEKRRTEDSGDCIDVLMNLKIKLGKLKTSELAHPIPIEFEKDDDSNHHIEFITAASNLRAENYDIPVADRMKTKQIAGRIIPAIATTTSVVAGLIMIELYKLVSKLNGSVNRDIPLDKFKSSFFNLALPFVAFSQPIGAEKKEYNNKTFTLWDRLEAVGPLTLSGFIDWLEEETKLKVSMVSSGVSLIYSFFMSSSKRNERMSMELREVVEEVSRNKIPSHVKSIVLEVVVTDENDDDVEVPYVLYTF